jgi:type IV pilus assembly protein PilP
MIKFIKKFSMVLFCVFISAAFLSPNCPGQSLKNPLVVRKKIANPEGMAIDSKKPNHVADADKTVPLKPSADLSEPEGVNQEKEAPVSASQKSAAEKPIYNPSGKTDPFEPLLKDQPKIQTDKLKPMMPARAQKTALEKIDLGQLKLTAVILASSGNKALVEEATGKGHIVSVGTFIGTQGGKVSDILKDRIIIEEKMKDIHGKIYVERKELKLIKIQGQI